MYRFQINTHIQKIFQNIPLNKKLIPYIFKLFQDILINYLINEYINANKNTYKIFQD